MIKSTGNIIHFSITTLHKLKSRIAFKKLSLLTGLWVITSLTLLGQFVTCILTIETDYCVTPGKIRLIALVNPSVTGTYTWSTGETTTSNYIETDLVGLYTVTFNGSGYICNGSVNVGQELVVNGNFSAGNTGFTSGYTYTAPTAGSLVPEGLYTVFNNPNFVHSNFWGRDHTTGSGNMMIVNGAGSPPPVVWQARDALGNNTLPVITGITYYFSAWAMSMNTQGNYAQLQFSINGTAIPPVVTLPPRVQNNNPPFTWTRFYGTWTPAAGVTTAQLRIVDLITAAGGNDFALDDISFGSIQPYAVLSGGATICAGGSANLVVTLFGTKPFSFTYFDGTSSTTISNINSYQYPLAVSPASTRTYTLTAVSDKCHAITYSGSATVNVLPTPTTSGTKASTRRVSIGNSSVGRSPR